MISHVVVKGGRERWKARVRTYKPRLKSERQTQGQRGGKGKGKEMQEKTKGVGMEDAEKGEDLMEIDRERDEDGMTASMSMAAPSRPLSDDLSSEVVFVVSKIRSGILRDGREVVLFSVLG